MKTLTLKDFMECIDYKVTEGSQYMWECYGPNAYQLDSWNGKYAGEGGHTINVVFDTATQAVYQMEAWDDDNDRAYRWINPAYISKLKDEYIVRELDFTDTHGTSQFIDIEVSDEMLEKARAIAHAESYDTRLQVELDLPDAEMLLLMKMAHEQDMTLNAFVERILEARIAELQKTDVKL